MLDFNDIEDQDTSLEDRKMHAFIFPQKENYHK